MAKFRCCEKRTNPAAAGRDESNRFKGVSSKPEIKANQTTEKQPPPSNHSSEKERRKPKRRKKRRKLPAIKIDRDEVRQIDPAQLPADAIFKGYEPVVVQDLKITTDNSRFLKVL